MTTCRLVFLDIDGQPSEVYYNTLKADGPIAAEKAYIEYMMSMDPKFSKERSVISDIDSLLEDSRKLKHTRDGEKYTDGGAVFERVTTRINKLKVITDQVTGVFGIKPEFDPVSISMAAAEKQQLKDIFPNTLVPKDKYVRQEEIDKYRKINPTDLEDRALRIRKSWEGSAKWGDHFHLVFQTYFEFYNKALAKNPNNMPVHYDLMRDVRVHLKSKKQWQGNRIENGNYSKIVKRVHDEIKLLEEKVGPLRILPELKLSSTTLGYAGTADLVLISEQGEAFIFDFKSKNERSHINFDKSTKAMFGEEFKDLQLEATPANSAVVQMSHYAAILEERGFKISPREGLRTIVLNGTYKPINEKDPNSDWHFLSIEIDKNGIRKNDSLHRHLVQETSVRKKEMENSRSAGTHGFINIIATEEVREGLAGTEPESQLHYIRESEEATVESEMKNIRYDDEGKAYVYRNNPNIAGAYNRLYLDTDNTPNKDVIRKYLTEDYRARMEDQIGLTNHIIAFWKAGSKLDPNGRLAGREISVQNLLHGISPETHLLMKAEDYHSSLRGVGSDVLIAENRLTGAISIFSAITAPNKDISFDNDGSGRDRKTVFGRYATDLAIQASGQSSDLLGNNKMHEFLGMKLGIVAMTLKKEASPNKPLMIENMRIATVGGKNMAFVTPTFISKEVNKLKKLLQFMPKGDVPADILEIISNPTLQKPESYGYTNLNHLLKMFEKHGRLLTDYTSKSALQDSIIQRLQEWKQGAVIPYELKREISNFRREVIRNKFHETAGRELTDKDPDVRMLNRVLIEINNIPTLTLQMMGTDFSRRTFRTAMTSADAIRERGEVLYKIASSNVYTDFNEFDIQHKSILENFIEESRNNGIGDTGKAYEGLMIDPKFENKEHPENFMKFKPDSELRPAALAYKNFILDQIDANFKLILTPQDYKSYLKGETWTRGLIPIIKANKGAFDRKTYESAASMIDAMKSNVKSLSKQTYDPHMAFGFGYEHAESYKGQVGNKGSQHGDARILAFGINGNNDVNPARDINTNIALMINNFTVSAFEQKHMSVISEVVEALDVELDQAEQIYTGFSTTNTRQSLVNWARMVIQNQYGDETGLPPKIADTLGRIVSMGQFAGSIKQAMVEFGTGTVQATTSLMSNSFLRLLDKNSGRFGVKDFIWGMGAIRGTYGIDTESKVFQILFDHNMVHADTAQLKQKEFADIRKGGLWRSRPLQFLNQLFFNTSLSSTFLAEIHSKGIHEAYEEYTVNGKIRHKYNETLDSRFYVYDENRPGWGQGKPPVTQEDKKKYALWKAVRAKLESEGSINEQGNMKIPMTAEERTSIKYYATKLYGSFHKDKEIGENSYAMVRMVLKYKTWFLQKVSNYYMVSDESMARGKWEWVEDSDHEDGGYPTWVGMPSEGIIQSVGFLLKQLNELKSISAFKTLNDVQKENLGKLLADALLLTIFLSFLMPWLNEDDDFSKTPFGKALKGAMKNATNDLNIAATAVAMGDSTAPVVNMAFNSISNFTNSAVALSMGNEEDAWKSLDGGMRSFGLYTTGRSVGQLVDNIVK